jgi:hypothetical protein
MFWTARSRGEFKADISKELNYRIDAGKSVEMS